MININHALNKVTANGIHHHKNLVKKILVSNTYAVKAVYLQQGTSSMMDKSGYAAFDKAASHLHSSLHQSSPRPLALEQPHATGSKNNERLTVLGLMPC